MCELDYLPSSQRAVCYLLLCYFFIRIGGTSWQEIFDYDVIFAVCSYMRRSEAAQIF